MEEKKWYQRQMRIQDTLVPDGEEFVNSDVAEASAVRSRLGFNAQHIEVIDLMNGGSDIVYFNTKNAKMQADLLTPIIEENRKNGIRNIVYVNVHWSSDSLAQTHPDWVQRDAAGNILPSGYGTGSVFCVNSGFTGWACELITDLAAYDIDGIFLDGPYFNYQACFCDACRLKFAGIYGYKPGESIYSNRKRMLDFMNFKKGCIAEFVKAARDTLKRVKPDAVIYMNGIQLNADKYCSRNNNLTVKYQDFLGAEGGFLYYNLRETSVLKPGMAAKLIETQGDGKPTVVFIAGRWSPWVRTLLTPAESWIVHAEAAANGAGTWYGIHAENDKDEGMEEIRVINEFLAKNDQYHAGTFSLAKTALLWSGKTANFYQSSAGKTDFTQEQRGKAEAYKSDAASDFEGWYEILSRSQEIFDVIDDYALENKPIQKYRTIILPNASCMSAGEVERIRGFVRDGGNIISTYDTSMYDEAGDELAAPQLKDVFGLSEVLGREELLRDHVKIEKCLFTDGIAQSFMPAPGLYLKVKPSSGADAYLHYREKQPSVYCGIMPETDSPVVIVNQYGRGKSVYFTGNIGLGFNRYQIPEFKRIARNAVRLLSASMVEVQGEVDSLDISLRSDGSSDILHVINYTGAMTRPIEKIITFRDVLVKVYDKNIKKVYDTKREIYIRALEKDDHVEFIMPELKEYEVFILSR